MRFLKFLLVSLLLLTPILGFGENGVTDKEIVVGCSNSFSGPLAYCGKEMTKYGMDIYFKYINDMGGIYGRKIKTIYYDDAYVPQNALANTKRLVEKDKVFVILCPQGTSTVNAIVPYLLRKKVPLLFPYQGSPKLAGKRYIFTSFTFYTTQTKILVKYLVERAHMKRIGVIYQHDAYGKTFLNQIKKELAVYGMRLAAAESVKRGSVDVSPQVLKLSRKKLDACLLVLVPGPAAKVLREAHKIGWKTRLVSVGPLTDEKFIILSGGVGEGVWGLSLWPDPVRSMKPGMVKYRQILHKYAPGHEPNRYSLYGYFYAMVFCEGLKRAGRNLTRERLIEALETIKNWDTGIISPISYSPTDHITQDDGFMVEVRGGRFVPISGWLRVVDGKLVERPL